MKREDLVNLGLTDEQIEKVIAENSKDVQSANAKAQKNNDELTRLRDVEKEYQTLKDQNLSDVEKANNALEKANGRIAELEKKMELSNQRNSAAEKFKITAEQASEVIKDDGSFDFDALGKIISEKEKTAVANFEKETLDKTPNPEGATGGKKEKEKTETEKVAEEIGKSLAGNSKEANAIVESYL